MVRSLVTRLTAPLIAATVLVTFVAVPASASPIVFTFSGADFSGSTDNIGGSLTVTITDIVGGVQLEIENNFLDPDAFPESFYFNTTFAPLAGGVGSCVSCAAIGTPTFSFGSDAYKADGDGFYDILIEMDIAPPPNRLTPGESAILQITSTTLGFNAASFLTLSAPGGGAGPFQAALHLQSLANGGSDWLAPSAPEPALLVLLGIGLVGTGRIATRKSKRRS